MKYQAFQVSLFGRSHEFDWEYESKKVIKALNELKGFFKEDLVLDTSSYDLLVLPYDIEDCSIYTDNIFQFISENVQAKPEGISNAEWLLSISKEDTAWTERRNQGLSGTFYHKIHFPDWFIQAIDQECDLLISEIQEKAEASLSALKAAEKAEKEEKDRLLQGVKWDIKERTIHDEGGRTTEYLYDITYNDKFYHLTDRNVFDFGRVVNYNNGMVGKRDGEWVLELYSQENGWVANSLTEDEKHIAEIVYKYGCYAKSEIRMYANENLGQIER